MVREGRSEEREECGKSMRSIGKRNRRKKKAGEGREETGKRGLGMRSRRRREMKEVDKIKGWSQGKRMQR